MTIAELLWAILLVAGLAGLGIWLYLWLHDPKHWGYNIGPISWLIHLVVFLSVRLTQPHEPDPYFQVWSLVLLGHAAGLIIFVGLIWILTRHPVIDY